MKRTFKIGGDEVHLPTLVVSLVIGAAAGWIAQEIGTPLPWLLGALIATAGLGIGNVRPFGHVIGVPNPIRTCFIPVIGVSIGATVTPEIFAEARHWWPTLLAVFAFIPIAHSVGYLIARRVGGVDAPTAYYGMMPGGFVESIPLGEAAGADIAQLATFQFLRLILLIVMIPVGFSLITGNVVGSAAGEVLGADVGLSMRDWFILILAGLIGGVAGKRAGIPAGIIMGPVLLSGLVHYVGWVEGGPPEWLIALTQLIIGLSFGARFAGRSPSVLLTGAKVVLVGIAAMLAVAAGFAAALHRAVGETWEAVFIAFAPGGLVEMSLIALSLEVSVIFVTVHHVLRIVLAVFVAKGLERFVLPTR